MTKFWVRGVRTRGTKSGRSRSRPYQLCAIVNHFLENLVTRGTFQFWGLQAHQAWDLNFVQHHKVISTSKEQCDSVLTLHSINLINLTQQLNQRALPALDCTYGMNRRSKISWMFISITLLALPCCCESQSSPVRNIRGPISKLHAASVASSSFALVYVPGI